MRYEWYVFHTISLALIMVPLLAFLSYFYGSDGRAAPPPDAVRVSATIVAFDEPVARYFWNHRQFVVAQTSHGRVSRESVWPNEIRGCQIGDAIEAYEKGFLVYLRPAPCP